MIRNAIGQQHLQRQRRLQLLQRIAAILLLLLAISGMILIPELGWWRLLFLLLLPLAVCIEYYGVKHYDRVLYEEREKEQIANALRRGLPECTVAVNHPLEEKLVDILVVGPPGVFVIHITQLRFDSIDAEEDQKALELQAAGQQACAGYPVEALIYARQMAMLKPTSTRVTATHTPGGIVDCIQRSRIRCNGDDVQKIRALLGI